MEIQTDRQGLSIIKDAETLSMTKMIDELTYMARHVEILLYGNYDKQIWADGLTKEMPMTEGVRNLLKNGKCEMVPEDINKVVCQNEEIKMLNIRNRKQSRPEKAVKTTTTTTTNT